ncbi:hypothetical protein pb186bvf_013368 [Paramecium bursaria]
MKFLKNLAFLQQANSVFNNHYPVMYREVGQKVKEFCSNDKLQYRMVDCTYGTGAHTKFILKQVPVINIVGMDLDQNMLQNNKIDNVILVNDNFVNFQNHRIDGQQFDIIFADLGYNIQQINDPSYGLSYKGETPLDMRYDKKSQLTASNILNNYSHMELSEIFRNYGQINNPNKLANKIIEERKQQQILNSNQLQTILNSIEMGSQLAQVFQSLRIAVNGELTCLEKLLNNIKKIDRYKDQLILIITFHSLESEMVQKFSQNQQTRFFGNGRKSEIQISQII